jgi:organic radical activating enzyme
MIGRISEIFESIQGEGIFFGERQIFVRLFDCNLECRFCDTKASNYREFQPLELLQELKKYGTDFHSVSFTGGEPLLQKDFLKQVLKLTRRNGFKNYLETNGTLPNELEEVIDLLDIVAMDLKLPTSTGLGDFWDAHRRFLRISSQKEVFIKAVINQSTQVQDLRKSIEIIKEVNPGCVLVLQPDANEEYELVKEKIEFFREICNKEDLVTCVIPQLHKMVGVK